MYYIVFSPALSLPRFVYSASWNSSRSDRQCFSKASAAEFCISLALLSIYRVCLALFYLMTVQPSTLMGCNSRLLRIELRYDDDDSLCVTFETIKGREDKWKEEFRFLRNWRVQVNKWLQQNASKALHINEYCQGEEWLFAEADRYNLHAEFFRDKFVSPADQRKSANEREREIDGWSGLKKAIFGFNDH